MGPLPLLEMPLLSAPPRPPAGAYVSYREQQIRSASPMQLVLMLYDAAIVGCERQDGDRAGRAITELVGALNFDAGEIAVDLFRLYEYCHWEIRRKRFSAAADVLRRLKASWEEALAQPSA